MSLENDMKAMDQVFDKFKSDKSERIADFAQIKPDLQTVVCSKVTLICLELDRSYRVNYYIQDHGVFKVAENLGGKFDPITGTLIPWEEVEALHTLHIVRESSRGNQ